MAKLLFPQQQKFHGRNRTDLPQGDMPWKAANFRQEVPFKVSQTKLLKWEPPLEELTIE